MNLSSLVKKGSRLAAATLAGLLVVTAVIVFARSASQRVYAAPIPPPEGYPKLSLSTKTVTPTLALPGGETLSYRVEIRNTGAYTATGVTLSDPLPANTTYNQDAQTNAPNAPVFDPANQTLTWGGEVGFDSAVIISYSVTITDTFEGVISNTAVISQAQIAEPVMMTAETLVTDQPALRVEKTSSPAKPGANKPLSYTLTVTNVGQPADNLPITVKDKVPADTAFKEAGGGGTLKSGVVTWNPTVSLGTGETSVFTFSVTVDDVISGTVIRNANYSVTGQGLPLSPGEVYTTTIIDPIFLISKQVDPHPPGSNREMTYTLKVFNKGSLATGLVITDVVPSGITYLDGGDSFSGGMVTWNLPELDSGASAQVTFTASIGDIAGVSILNDDYGVCSAEGVCQSGEALNNLVQGPTFQAGITLDPVAKKPGGGTGPVTPTIVIQNLGPGSAIDAMATIYFTRISVSLNDLFSDPPNKGTFSYGPLCGDKCVSYHWNGDLDYGEVLTLTALGQSSVGGEEGTHYTATLVMTDSLGAFVTEPYTATEFGTITHMANLIPTKSAPPEVGAGQQMTYTIRVYNSGLSTDIPPSPWLTETIPLSTSLVSASDGGASQTVGERTVISWTLPAMSPGDRVLRSFSVLVDDNLISGTQIVNDDYRTSWYSEYAKTILTHTGEPITTVVKEIGLIDSFKTVTPTWALPGEDNVFTYTIHVVNSGPDTLTGVKVHDVFPWQDSTYQRDAVASAGKVISDIVSLDWTGTVGPYDSELITLTVWADEGFQGPLTNTATIKHKSLLEDAVVEAVAYVTDKPVLKISKSAAPDPVPLGGDLVYTIKVTNLGQQATGLTITDTIPAGTSYVQAGASGQLVGDHLEWSIPVLDPGEERELTFQVTVEDGDIIINENYGVTCAEGVSATGPPVTTLVRNPKKKIFLPIIMK